MNKFTHAARLVGLTITLSVGIASGVHAMEVSQVQLGVADSGGSSCPRDAKVTAWAHTNGPGTVKFVIRNDSGGKTGELSASAVKGPTGNYLATYSHTFKITTNVDIKYMAEAVGHGKISNWVPFKATCGPQPRKDKAATKSGASPPAKKTSETEKGKPQPRADKPATKPSDAGPNAKHASEGDKDGKPASGGKPLPSGGKPTAECKPMMSATRKLAVTRAGGLATAQIAWQSTAAAAHGAAYGRWSNAKDQSSSCKRKGLTFDCTVKARPCKG